MNRTKSEQNGGLVNGRLEARFAALKSEGRAGFVTFLMAGDPDLETSFEIISGLPKAGVDIIEIGMPFSDPMADGPAVQEAALRALAAGTTLTGTLDLVARFRQTDNETPIVLMGYFNPILTYGVDAFIRDALASGIDGVIVVDLPPEEDAEFCVPALESGLRFIRLATPTTDDNRLPRVLANTSGFVYYVSIAGITGTSAPNANRVQAAVSRLKRHTELPIAVGFGIATPDHAQEIARAADAVVVGSALVKVLKNNLDGTGRPEDTLVEQVLDFAGQLANGVHGAVRAPESV